MQRSSPESRLSDPASATSGPITLSWVPSESTFQAPLQRFHGFPGANAFKSQRIVTLAGQPSICSHGGCIADLAAGSNRSLRPVWRQRWTWIGKMQHWISEFLLQAPLRLNHFMPRDIRIYIRHVGVCQSVGTND